MYIGDGQIILTAVELIEISSHVKLPVSLARWQEKQPIIKIRNSTVQDSCYFNFNMYRTTELLKSFIFSPYPILEVKKCVCSQKKELINDMKFIFFFQKKATSIVPILP